jgi:hypothetical protein
MLEVGTNQHTAKLKKMWTGADTDPGKKRCMGIKKCY